jgi:general L-amino acid transport system substrate-binding protein
MQRLVCVVVVGVALLTSLSAWAQSTLETVKKRGQVVCGVDGTLPGFSFLNAVKEWEGLDVDLCRAIAAATLGDAAKVQFVQVTAKERFDRLAAGDFDVLTRNTTGTLQRTAGTKVRFVVANYYDGQAFVVPKKLKIDQLAGLRGANVCVTKGTTHEFNRDAWFSVRRLAVVPIGFESDEAMYSGFFASRCIAVTADSTALASTFVRSGKAADYMMLPEVISKEPLGPYVRDGDSQWHEIVRWTHYAMVEAEERGITPKSIDALKREVSDPTLRLFLGVDPGNGKALGLSENWAFNIVKQVGNYGDVYERNVGMGSALKFARGVNALWSKGGLMYALPLR